jgi:GNAT superfamily N-acetyltransferase
MQEQIIEEQEGDEHIFKLIIDKKIMCTARTLAYRHLEKIKTTTGEEGKGYGKKLLTYIEKVAKEHDVKVMETSDIDPYDYATVSFFKTLGYRFSPVEGDKQKFIEAAKDLWDDETFRLIKLVDKKFKRTSFDMFIYSPYFMTFCMIILIFIAVEAYLFSELNDLGKQLTIAIPFSALLIAFFIPFYNSILETRIERNYMAISKNEEERNKPLIKALVKMKAENAEFCLEQQIYNMNPSMFTKEKLLERLYDKKG